MNNIAKWIWAAGVLSGAILSSGAALAQNTPADAILKEIEAVKRPSLDAGRRSDQDYIKEFIAKVNAANQKRGELILKLYTAAPDHPRIATLMPERWRSVVQSGSTGDALIKEIDDVFTKTKNPKLKLEAAFAKAQIKLAKSQASGVADVSGVDEFIKFAPKDPRAPRLLSMATHITRDQTAKDALETRILKEFPDSRDGMLIKGGRRQHDGIGKLFELEFADAITGSTVSIKNLKGKVVVVDFWATWCGPCVGEMPHMKELYAKYRDQGVEFIGVSLDQPKENGGLDKLKKFVKDNEIAWPQYYQGNYWDSEFSCSWGINSIPCVFVVDTEGKLHSTDARGKLEEMIPELLKKKAAHAGAGAGGQ
jgi:thiol-disulfide isomerase/thioredoxin